jgi:hypothetical protein
MTWIYALLALFAILNIGDGLSTYRFIKSDGIEREGNVRMRELMRKHGVVPVIIYAKVATVATFAGITWLAMSIDDGYQARTIWALLLGMACLWMAYTVADNLDLID